MPILKSALALFVAALATPAQTGVLTYHNDNARSGQYLSEVLLTPGNVKPGLFGKRLAHLVDGPVFAQPLYLPRVKMAGKGFRNVVFAATGHNSLYAFDADDDSNEQPLWQVSFNDAAHGVTAVPADDVRCEVIWPELGIIGTPVIDAASGTIYLIAETKEPGPQYVFRLHAIDVASGAERSGSPVEVSPPGFVPFAHKHRSALLLVNGIIYSTWGSNCDLGAYHGWVMAHDAKTLKRLAVFNSTADGDAASFWNAGAGASADSAGNIYVVSANGDFNAGTGGASYGDSVVKLAAPQLTVADYFTPFNQADLALNDLDLGSSGALLLPDEAGSAAHPHLLFTAGKEARMYLLDRDELGGAQFVSDTKALASLPILSKPAFGMAAYFNGNIYVPPEKLPLRAYPVSNGAIASTPSAQAKNSVGGLGTVPSISANGASDGIVWTIFFDGVNGVLRAHNAANLDQLFDSSEKSADYLYGFSEFSVPTVADGKVYVGTTYSLDIFGELASDPPAAAAVTNAASFLQDPVSPGSLITLFGSGLAPATAAASSLPLPISLADVSVLVNGVVAPLLYVSPRQINAQVPFETPPGPATVAVRVTGKLSPPVNISVRSASPGIFTDALGQAAVLNADGSRNQPQNPARVGTFVSLYLTGQGPVDKPVEDGAPAPIGTLISATAKVSAKVGGMAADIQFAGLAPGFAGLAQINLKVPPLASGDYPVIVTIGGAASNSARLSVSAP